jgi:hypothetical protein
MSEHWQGQESPLMNSIGLKMLTIDPGPQPGILGCNFKFFLAWNAYALAGFTLPDRDYF